MNREHRTLLEFCEHIEGIYHTGIALGAEVDAFLAERKEKPLYPHTCDLCVFLGQWTDPDGGCCYDLYSCMQGRDALTYVARYGAEDHEYQSGTGFVGIDPAITEADRRYKKFNEK